MLRNDGCLNKSRWSSSRMEVVYPNTYIALMRGNAEVTVHDVRMRVKVFTSALVWAKSKHRLRTRAAWSLKRRHSSTLRHRLPVYAEAINAIACRIREADVPCTREGQKRRTGHLFILSSHQQRPREDTWTKRYEAVHVAPKTGS